MFRPIILHPMAGVCQPLDSQIWNPAACRLSQLRAEIAHRARPRSPASEQRWAEDARSMCAGLWRSSAR